MNEVFKALADPTRREILRTLRTGEKTAGELADLFPLTKSALSRHFTVLRTADLVTSEKRGTSVDIDVDAIGHDLLFGTTVFRSDESGSTAAPAEAPAEDWATPGTDAAWAASGEGADAPDTPSVLGAATETRETASAEQAQLVGAERPF